VKKHIFTVILLLLGGISFLLSFLVIEDFQIFCTIGTFVFPTLAAILEVCFAIKTDIDNLKRDKMLESHEDSLTWHEII
jgi:hypothetical protein